MFELIKFDPVVGKASTLIQCPINDIFNFVGTNFIANYPRWSPEIVELKTLTEGPVKVGTMCHQVRVDMGYRSESTFKVTVFQPSQYISFEGISGAYRCNFVFEASTSVSENCIKFTFELLNLDIIMKPFEKIIRRVVQEGAEKTVMNIKKLIEIEVTDAAAKN